MAQVDVFYEPDTELLTVFWQAPAKIRTELGKHLGREETHLSAVVGIEQGG